MDVCWSNYKNWFAAKKLNFTYNLENLGNYYNSYKDLMIFWKSIFKDNIFDIYYEDLIADPDKKIKEVLLKKLKQIKSLGKLQQQWLLQLVI